MRRRLLPLFLALAGPGCIDPVAWQAREISFEAPEKHIVARGETVDDIARAYRVSPDDVRAWNNLGKRKVGAGEILHVWRGRPTEPSLASVISHRARPESPVARQETSRRREPVRAGIGLPSLAGLGAALGLPSAPPVEDLVVGTGDPIDPVTVEADAPGRAREAGLLNPDAVADVGGLDGLDGLSGPGRSLGTAGLAGRTGSLGGTGTAESLDDVGSMHALGPQPGVPAVAVVPPRLAMPAAKRCLSTSASGPLAELGISGSKGLTAAQVRTSLSSFGRVLGQCVPTGTVGTYQPVFGLTIGCDGRVSSSWTTEAGGLPRAVTSCIETTLRYAAFPAHDMPAGLEVSYPLVICR